MNNKKIIFVAGLSRSGKNSLCDIIKKKYVPDAIELSFAEPLRESLKGFVKKEFNIDVYTKDFKLKELIRPLLVATAHIYRQTSGGGYFIDKLRQKIQTFDDKQTILVSDARFKESKYDEADFCLENGYLIHISKYFEKQGFIRKYKVFQSPPNPTEAENDPKIKKLSSYSFEWPDLSHKNLYKDQLIEELYPFCKPVLDEIFNNE